MFNNLLGAWPLLIHTILVHTCCNHVACHASLECDNNLQNNTNQNGEDSEDKKISPNAQQTSMSTLIIWNISKALESNPSIELRTAIKKVQERLENNCCDLNKMISQCSEERHLTCAILAWQELGHKGVDSLCRFIETKRNESVKVECSPNKRKNTLNLDFIESEVSNYCGGIGTANFDTSVLIEPVIKLPVNTKTVIRLENTPNMRQSMKQKGCDKEIMNKIDAACCKNSRCVERVAELDKAIAELRMRAGSLASREGLRVELLERAEAAWKDLELGYQKRLVLAEEKEDDIAKQAQKMVEERNNYKNICATEAKKLKEREDAVEKDRVRLTQIEKEVCERACLRLRLSQEAAQSDAAVVEQQCKASQLDRDLQLKEEQTRRKLLNMKSEVESTRVLFYEVERVLRTELATQREQIAYETNQLLQEEAEIKQTKEEIEKLKKEKFSILEGLESCKIMCDSRLQAKIEGLKKKREQLMQLKDIVTESQCKVPIDVIVEAKRTPSLVALCKCNTEDDALVWMESCSCTSLRSRVMSNLLADLFAGLQAQLGGSGLQMPCYLLKCLENKHNWDRANVIKTMLQNFFSQLLIGELDIAIATSIENNHAKWIAASYADKKVENEITDTDEVKIEYWQEQAFDRNAQKLSDKLAEQLFKDRAEQIVQRTKDIVTSSPSTCDCKTQSAAYSYLVKPEICSTGNAPDCWRRTFQDIMHLRAQVENLKRETIKKEDMRLLENVTKLYQLSYVKEEEPVSKTKSKEINKRKENNKHNIKNSQFNNTDISGYYFNHNKIITSKKKHLDVNKASIKGNRNISCNIEKTYKKNNQAYTVNMCLYGTPKKTSKLINKYKKPIEKSRKENLSGTIPQLSTIRQIKPIINDLESTVMSLKKNKMSTEHICKSNCECFHKKPSNTSIDQLLEVLKKWNCELNYQNGVSGANSEIFGKEINDLNIGKAINHKKSIQHDFKSSNNVNECLPKCKELDLAVLSPNTESDYMDEINLDKSNENLCEYANDHVSNSSKKNRPINENEINISELSSMKINSEVYNGKQSSEIKSKYKNLFISSDKKYPQLLQTTSENQQHDIKMGKTLEGQNRLDNFESNGHNIVHTDAKDVTKNKNILNCDYESYNIKLLGVTLTNTNSQNKFHHQYNLKDNQLLYKNKNLCFVNTFQNKYKNTDKNQTEDKPEGSQVYLCKSKFNDNKSLMGDFCNNKDKEIDSQSFENNVIDRPEICICFDNHNLEESQNLEVNTFHLLEEHLKRRLKEFRQYSCKSSCISSSEEEKIFSAIFQRVKHVISDNTNKLTCKYPGDGQTQGSWNRAYSLLQEYLKTKIKRVQCFCTSSKISEKTILLNILNEVCNLIESDFHRLKKLCKCKNSVVCNNSNDEYDKPERDIKIDLENNVLLNKWNEEEKDQISNITNIKLSKQNPSNVLTQNISAQVSHNFEKETKFCDTMGIEIKNIQTTESHLLYVNKCCNTSDPSYHCSFIKYKNNPYFSQTAKNEIFVNYCMDAVKPNQNCSKINIEKCDTYVASEGKKSNNISNNNITNYYEKQPTPYIGYTIDCTCNKILGLCICTKSLHISNNDQYSKSLKEYKIDTLFHRDTSYIMDSVSDKNKTKQVTYEKNNDYILPVFVKEETVNTCEIKLSAHNDNGILLKDSFNKLLDMSNHMVNTSNDIIKEKDCILKNILENNNKSYPTNNSSDKILNTRYLNCECEMVPICHVKMLVENIEEKLINSNCTCDTCSKICPVHTHTNV